MTGQPGGSTVSTASSPPAQVLQNYNTLTNAAFSQAGQPQSQYAGPLVAGFTPQQTQGFQEVQNAQGMAAPYINAAGQAFGQAMTPFNQTVGNYESPYTGAVTNALQGLFNQQNAQQLQQVRGNATAQGAFGGDREGVAEALTTQQQNLSQAPAMAQALQGGYQTALGAAEAQGWLGQQGAFGLGNLGQEAQNTTLAGANALLGAGGLQQQLAQEQLNIPYEQFQSAQGYPWQVLGSLSPIVSGTGSLSGGTGSTSYPGPSPISQIAGLGITGLGTYGLLNQTGALSGLSGLFGGGAAADAGLAAAAASAPYDVGAGAAGITALQGLATPLAFAGAAEGGRIGYADGGGIGASPPTGLPAVPTISLDYLSHPGPAIKGSGPPQAPQGNPEQFQGQTPLQDLQLFSGMSRMLDNSGIGAGDRSAFGGRIGLQAGGEADLSAVETTSAPLAGMAPMQQGFVQKLQQMPMDQLQAMSVRVPPSTPYGQLVQRVLNSRRMSSSAAPNQVSSASGVPIGTGIGQVGQAGQTGQMSSSAGGIGQPPMMAAGGATPPALAEDPDMDPHPVVDHSGDTVVIHYPSEGKSLDLGIPSSPSQRKGYAEGGKLAGGGSSMPSVVSGTGAVPSFNPSWTSPSGLQIPQLSMDAFAPTANTSFAPTAGGGLGNWFNPLPQFQPSSTPGTFPETTPITPGIIGLSNSFGGPLATGMAGGAAAIPPGFVQLNSSGNWPGKSGGRIGYADGGDTGLVMDPSGGISMPNVSVAPGSPLLTDNPPVAAPAEKPAEQPPQSHAAAPSAPSPTPPASVASSPATEVARDVGQEPAPKTTKQPEGGIGKQTQPSPAGNGDIHHQVRQLWLDAGYPAAAVDGITRRINEESQFNPSAVGDNSTSFGLYQHHSDRAIKLMQWSAANGMNPTDPITQTKFAIHEMAGGDPTAAKSRPALMQATDPAQAYNEFTNSFERPASVGGGGDKTIMPGRGGIGSSSRMQLASNVGGIGEPAPRYGADVGQGAGIGSSSMNDAIERIVQQNMHAPSTSSAYASPWMPLIAAGLGMMSSRSPYPGVGIGQGGLEGLKALSEQQRILPEAQLRGAQAQMAGVNAALYPYRMGAMQKALQGGGRGAQAPATSPPLTGGTATGAPAGVPEGVGPPINAGMTDAGQASPADAGAAQAAAASAHEIMAGPEGLPVPRSFGQDPQFAALDKSYADLADQIAQTKAVANADSAFDLDKAPQYQATLARLNDTYINAILRDPRMQATGESLKKWAGVAPDVSKAGQIAAVENPYRIREALAREAGRPLAVKKDEVATTGFQAMPPELQNLLLGSGFGAAMQSPPATAPGGEGGRQPGISTHPEVAPTTTPGGAPSPAEQPPFERPPSLAADPTLTMPESHLVRVPGGIAAAPTLPGIASFQADAATAAKHARDSITQLTEAASALDSQHATIVAAAVPDNFYAPGAFSAERQQVGNVVNTMAQIIGAKPPLDEKNLGNSIDIDKAAFGLSTKALQGFSPRPAQIEWMASRNSVPSNMQTAYSAILLSNTLRLVNGFQQGMNQYVLDAYKNGVEPAQASAQYQRVNGSRIAGAALAETYVDLAKARPNDQTSRAVNALLAVPPEHRQEAIDLFDKNFKPLNNIDSKAFGVPSWGSLFMTMAGAHG